MAEGAPGGDNLPEFKRGVVPILAVCLASAEGMDAHGGVAAWADLEERVGVRHFFCRPPALPIFSGLRGVSVMGAGQGPKITWALIGVSHK